MIMKRNLNHNWKFKYFAIWTGQGISVFTSSVLQMAIVWYLTNTTKSAFILSLATLIGYLPRVILGPFIGVIIDRYSRRKIMILSDCFIMLCSLLLTISGKEGKIPILVILFVLFTRSVGAAFHNPSLQAITPTLVPKEELTRYAGISQSVESVSMLLSPGVAAFLFSFIDLPHLVFFDVAGALIAVLILSCVTIPSVIQKDEIKKSGVLLDAREGVLAIRRISGLSSLVLVSALYAIIYFPIGTLFPLISMEYFQGSFRMSGVVETVFSVGMLLGAVILGVFGNRIHKARAISFSIGLYGSGLLITGLLPRSGILYFVILSFFMGISLPFYRGVKLAVIQLKVKEDVIGRVLSLVTSMESLAMPIGLLLAGILVGVIGVNRWFFLSGILSLILMAVSIAMPSFRRCGEE